MKRWEGQTNRTEEMAEDWLFFKKTWFNSHHRHGNSKLPETPVPGTPTPSSGLCRHCTHIVHKYTSRQNTHTHKNKGSNNNNNNINNRENAPLSVGPVWYIPEHNERSGQSNLHPLYCKETAYTPSPSVSRSNTALQSLSLPAM